MRLINPIEQIQQWIGRDNDTVVGRTYGVPKDIKSKNDSGCVLKLTPSFSLYRILTAIDMILGRAELDKMSTREISKLRGVVYKTYVKLNKHRILNESK